MANCTILIFRFDRRFNIMLLKSMSLYVVVYLCCILFVYGTKQSFKTRNQACYPLRCSTSVPKNGAHVLDWPDSEQRSALSTALVHACSVDATRIWPELK